MLQERKVITHVLLLLAQVQVALSSSPLLWAMSGGGTRAFTSTLGYISLFHQLDLISTTKSKFTSISANSGGAGAIVPAFFSSFFLEQTMVDADAITTLVRDYLEQQIPPVDANDPRCDIYRTLASFSEDYKWLLVICNRLSPYENFDFGSWIEESVLSNIATFFNDTNYPNQTMSPENINPTFRETDLLIEVGLTPSGVILEKNDDVEDDRMMIALGPNSGDDVNFDDVVYSTPIVTYYIINREKNSWMYAVDEKELPFETHVYSIPNKYVENAWSDYPVAPGSAGGALTAKLRFQKVSNSTTFQEPFEGKHATVSQVIGSAYAAFGIFSPLSPVTFAMSAAVARDLWNASAPPNLLQLGLILIQTVVENTYESLTLAATSVCSQWPQSCGRRDGRFIDGGLLELLSLAGAVANYQANHDDNDVVVKAIVTHHNLGYITYIDFLSYFETTWNDGVAPGDYYWPNGNNETGGNPPITFPQRSYQIFEDYLDQDLLDKMTHKVIGGTNMTTTIIEATTVDNPAFGIQAGLKVHVLYILTNANTSRVEVSSSSQIPDYTRLANTIASNPDLAQIIRDFVSEEDETTSPSATPTTKPSTTEPSSSLVYGQKKSKKAGYNKKNPTKQKTHENLKKQKMNKY